MSSERIKNIREHLETIHNTIKKIKTKISQTGEASNKINDNKLLVGTSPNSNLLFQINILKTEYIYYNSLNKLILETFSSEIQDLINKSTSILSLLNKLEYNSEEKTIILDKIKKIKICDSISFSLLNENIDILLNNLPLIDECIALFTTFIEASKEASTTDNVHNTMYELDIHYKKEKLLLEYNKCSDIFEKTIEYFENVSLNILNDVQNSNILKLYL